MRRIQVLTGKPYEIRIERGLHEQIATLLSSYRGRDFFLLSDENTERYAQPIQSTLIDAGFKAKSFTVPAGEETKSIEWLSCVLEKMASERLHRDAILLAIGGGVIGDLGGFAAAVYLRGVDFIQIPTSLLATMDSSVGGKTGINLRAGKNLAGAFHQPIAVFADPNAFRSLSPIEWASGVSETIKHGVLKSEALFTRIANGMNSSDPDLEACIEQSVRIKAEVVAEDEKEQGIRKILNFGHTFGHAVEKASEYEIPHGHAVAIGMAMMARACAKRGICSKETKDRIEAALLNNALPIRSDFSDEILFTHMQSDKKAAGDSIYFIVVEEIGSCRIKTCLLADSKQWLEDAK